MLPNLPIRIKFLAGLLLLTLLVLVLSGGSLYTTYSYRSLVKNVSWRAEELRVAAQLNHQVTDLRMQVRELSGQRAGSLADDTLASRQWTLRSHFAIQLEQVAETLRRYRNLLRDRGLGDSSITKKQEEWATAQRIEDALDRVRTESRDEKWMIDGSRITRLDSELKDLHVLTEELPTHLHARLAGFAGDVRSEYRTLIVGTWALALAAGIILFVFSGVFYRWIVRPLQILIEGSRRVAAGRFGFRIRLDTEDEMAELASAMNDMTNRFCTIRDDLDRQVQERTQQVVRSEQLASVGFLAAGVAHEINNPLASISMCAESLETRIAEILGDDHESHPVVTQYLRMIQEESFRCKEITEKLLDFSRVGQVERQQTDLGELIQGVVEMVRHLGKYKHRNIETELPETVNAPVNQQEFKQTILNLLTNALDSLEEGGTVKIQLGRRDEMAQITFTDNGCGMDAEVLAHVFEPFFTRRRGGQGTGLGMSITHRIISDHGGEIDASSAGPGKGSTFRVRLPINVDDREKSDHYRAA